MGIRYKNQGLCVFSFPSVPDAIPVNVGAPTWVAPTTSLPTGTVHLTYLASHQQLARESGEPLPLCLGHGYWMGSTVIQGGGSCGQTHTVLLGLGIVLIEGRKLGCFQARFTPSLCQAGALSSVLLTPALQGRQDTTWFHRLGCRVGWNEMLPLRWLRRNCGVRANVCMVFPANLQ